MRDKKMEEQSREILMLRNQVFSLMQSICTDLSCTLRRKDMEFLHNITKSKECSIKDNLTENNDNNEEEN